MKNSKKQFPLLISFLFLPALVISNRDLSPVAAFFLAIAVCLQGSVQWIFRPVFFSFLCFSSCYLVLDAEIKKQGGAGKKLYVLPLLFFLWANLHPAFILGLFLLGTFVVLKAFS